MNICIVAWMLDIEKHAGVGRVGAEILYGLRERGHEISTISLNNSSHYAYLKYLLLDIHNHLPPADVYVAQSVMETIWLPKHKTVPIVHDLIPLLHADVAGANMNAHPVKTFLGSRFYWFGARQASRCARIVTNSEQTKLEMESYFNITNGKVRTFPLGVREDIDALGKRDKVYRVGYIGQLDRRKRVDLLVTAFHHSQIDGELVIGGNGPDRAKLEALAEGDKRIKFLGFVPDAVLNSFYNSLSVFCFPSAAEGWGLPIAEAFACKKPVIVMRDSFIPDELKSRCHVTANLSYSLRAMRTMAHNNVEANYNFAKSLKWSSFVEGLEGVLGEIVATKNMGDISDTRGI